MSSARLPAVLDSLAPLRELIKSVAGKAGLASNKTYRLMLAVDEVATNIIVHGYEEQGRTGVVDVSVSAEGDEVVVRLEDNAVAFDPRASGLPDNEDLAQPLETRDEGGLGLMLAMDGVDRFDYAWVDGRNHNTFAMRLDPSVGEEN